MRRKDANMFDDFKDDFDHVSGWDKALRQRGSASLACAALIFAIPFMIVDFWNHYFAGAALIRLPREMIK